jgi:ATP-dependent protease ClpP protease subunit
MSRFFCRLIFFGLLMSNFSFAEVNNFEPSSIRKKLGLDLNVMMIEEQGTRFTLIGAILPSTATDFIKMINKEENIKVVYIDSVGGDVNSAIDIASIIKNRKLDIVVDGRCFSACASYIFPAAVNKVVLPGSIVAIHEESSIYKKNGTIKLVQELDAENAMTAASDNLALENLKKLREKEVAFYRRLRLTKDLHNSYVAYLQNRKGNFGSEKINFESSYPNCPPIQLWALNKQQLISMGVTGIGEFSYPRTTDEQKMLTTDFKLPQGSVYFGNAKHLEQYCKGISSGWFFRKFYDARSSINSILNFSKTN